MTLENNPRKLLSELRQGDFAHPGDTEAIDMVIAEISTLLKVKHPKVLDVGCGMGGTADYFERKCGFEIYGIDIDKKALDHAISKYPKISFLRCDVIDIEEEFPAKEFDFIYMFNVFYAISQQQEALKHLAKIAKPETLLVISDYVSNNENLEFPTDLAGKPIQPIIFDNLKKWLDSSGWEIVTTTDITSKYQLWYEEFLIKLAKDKANLKKNFSLDTIEKVETTFSFLLENIKNNKMGGKIIYAKLR